MQTVAIPDTDDAPMLQFSWHTNRVYQLDRTLWDKTVQADGFLSG